MTVLETHADFPRDFRGDTVHPSTLRAMHELGLLDALLRVPHQRAYELQAEIGAHRLTAASFRHLDPRWNFVAFMPQWDFLNFLAQRSQALPRYALHMRTSATGLIEEDGRVVGVRALGPRGRFDVHADLVVACDGRRSTLRDCAGLSPVPLGAPMDVLWFALSGRLGDGAEPVVKLAPGRVFIRINRGAHWRRRTSRLG